MAKADSQYKLRYDLRMEAESEDAEIMVYGEIVEERWDEDSQELSAKDFDGMLKDAKARGAKRLNLRINSPGGAVWQASAMRAMLMNSGLDINVDIEGLCASAATLLACVPGAHVRMYGGSIYMIHNPHSLVLGDAAYLEHEAAMLRKSEEEIADIYALRTGMSVPDIRELMDDETWFTAKDAIAFGFADEYVESGEAAASVSAVDLQTMKTIYAHVPDEIWQDEVSNDLPPAAAAESTEIQDNNEEVRGMDIKDMTIDDLKAQAPELYAAVATQAVTAERERIQEIDDLTMAGYEALATEAKANGTSALEYHKMLVKAQKEKGEAYMRARVEETQVASSVGNAAPVDGKADEDAAIADIVKYAQNYTGNSDSMYAQ